jgi:hypothetical protein
VPIIARRKNLAARQQLQRFRNPKTSRLNPLKNRFRAYHPNPENFRLFGAGASVGSPQRIDPAIKKSQSLPTPDQKLAAVSAPDFSSQVELAKGFEPPTL